MTSAFICNHCKSSHHLQSEKVTFSRSEFSCNDVVEKLIIQSTLFFASRSRLYTTCSWTPEYYLFELRSHLTIILLDQLCFHEIVSYTSECALISTGCPEFEIIMTGMLLCYRLVFCFEYFIPIHIVI